MLAEAKAWLDLHPRIGRPVKVIALTQMLSMMAVGMAPHAAASTSAGVLNWTGLKDTYGVPIGAYSLALASVRDQLLEAGPEGSAIDPSTWMAWMMHGFDVLATFLGASSVLSGLIGLAITIFALGLWVMKLTVSSYWLTVIGTIAQAITTAVIDVTTRWGLVMLTVPLGVGIGVMTMHRGERGRGWMQILLAMAIPGLSVAVFSDPAGLMYGPDGLLQFGRKVGFSVAQVATHGHAIAGGGFTGQIDTLTSSLITHAVREPLEVFNFGHVVDRVGGCGSAYSHALVSGTQYTNPVEAMKSCGDKAAVSFAQHLDGGNIGGALILLVALTLLSWFLVSSGWSVLKVSVKAIYTTAKLLPTLWAGGIPGVTRTAVSEVWKFFKFGIEVTVYIVYVGVIGLADERLITQPLPAELGGSNPFAHLVMMAAASIVALYLLRVLRADLENRPPGRGVLGRASDVALGLGMHAALGGVGSAAKDGAGWLGNKLKNGGRPPWDEPLELHGNADASQVHGAPAEGFDPVSSDPPAPEPGTDGSHTTGGGTGAAAPNAAGGAVPTGAAPAGGATAIAGSSASPGGFNPVDALANQANNVRERSPRSRRREADAAQGRLDELADGGRQPGWADPAGAPQGIDPIATLGDVGLHEDIPFPDEPPPDEQHLPPPFDDGPSTVDPITGR